MNTSFTYSNRFVDRPERVFGNARFHSNATWIDNRTVLATTEHLFDYGGNVMDSVAVDTLGGGPDSYRNWFSNCVAGCDDIQTLVPRNTPGDRLELSLGIWLIAKGFKPSPILSGDASPLSMKKGPVVK